MKLEEGHFSLQSALDRLFRREWIRIGLMVERLLRRLLKSQYIKISAKDETKARYAIIYDYKSADVHQKASSKVDMQRIHIHQDSKMTLTMV